MCAGPPRRTTGDENRRPLPPDFLSISAIFPYLIVSATYDMMIKSHVDCPHCAHAAQQIEVLITIAAMLQRQIELLDRVYSLPEYQNNPYVASNEGAAVAKNVPVQGETIQEACILTSLYMARAGTLTTDAAFYVYHPELKPVSTVLAGPGGKHLIGYFDDANGINTSMSGLNIYVPKGSKLGFEFIGAGLAAGPSIYMFANLIPAKDTTTEQFRGRN